MVNIYKFIFISTISVVFMFVHVYFFGEKPNLKIHNMFLFIGVVLMFFLEQLMFILLHSVVSQAT